MTVLSCLFLWLISQGIQPVVPALTPADLHVQLSLRGGKTTFRQGEAIRLILSFTADRAGYILDETTTIPASPIDDVIVSPNTGVFHWLDRYSEGFRYSPDYSALFPVSATPATVELALNQWVRFDAAGEYTLRIVTRRVSPIGIAGFRAGSPFQAVTNAVTFRIEPMSDTEEAAEVGRLSTLLASTSRILSLQQERCEDLAFLPGDDAAREKVRQYLHPEGHLEGNWTRDLSFGFYISRHPTVIVSMFDDLLRDVTHPARSDWVVQATAMRNWIDALADPASAAPPPLVGGIVFPANPEKIFQSYLSQLTDSLASRTGISRRQTAVTVLTLHVGHGPVPAEARRVVVEEFDQLDVSDQRWLVQSRWRDLRDPSLLPALRQLVAGRDPTGRGPLIEALRDLSPADGRAAIVAEITNPKATTDLSLLQSLPDKVLPEVDTTLLTQVQTLAAAPPLREAYLLSAKTALLARYGSQAIRDEVLALYTERWSTLAVEPQGNLLAYLVKWQTDQAGSLVEEAVAASRDADMLLFRLTELAYSNAIDALLRRRLESDDPRTASEAAWRLSAHGPATARTAIQARLDRWLRDWQPSAATLEDGSDSTKAQAQLQTTLIAALLGGHTWALADAEATQLKATCLTTACRARFKVR